MQACFFALSKVLPIAAAREAVRQRWSLYEQLARIQVPS